MMTYIKHLVLVALSLCLSGCLGCQSSLRELKDILQEVRKLLESTHWDYKMDMGELSELNHIKQPIIIALKFGRVIIRDEHGKLHDTTHDWYLAPQKSGEWDYKTLDFIQNGKVITHLHPQKPKEQQGTGVLSYAIQGLYDA